MDYNPQRVNEARDRVIDEVPLSVVVEGYGIPIYRDKIVCPFHEDDNPSCFVSDERKTYHCFGCGAKGTVVEFKQEYENIYNQDGIHMTQVEAIIRLSEQYNIEIPNLTDKTITRPKKTERRKREVDHDRIIIKRIEQYERRAKGLEDLNKKVKVYTILDNYYLGRLEGEVVVNALKGEFK